MRNSCLVSSSLIGLKQMILLCLVREPAGFRKPIMGAQAYHTRLRQKFCLCLWITEIRDIVRENNSIDAKTEGIMR